MSRVVIPLQTDEREALIRLACSEMRTPSDQAHFIIRNALQNNGLLPKNQNHGGKAKDISRGEAHDKP